MAMPKFTVNKAKPCGSVAIKIANTAIMIELKDSKDVDFASRIERQS